jgi:hypothetical protein
MLQAASLLFFASKARFRLLHQSLCCTTTWPQSQKLRQLASASARFCSCVFVSSLQWRPARVVASIVGNPDSAWPIGSDLEASLGRFLPWVFLAMAPGCFARSSLASPSSPAMRMPMPPCVPSAPSSVWWWETNNGSPLFDDSVREKNQGPWILHFPSDLI